MDDTTVLMPIIHSANTKETPCLPSSGNDKITLSFWNHACLFFETRDCSFLIDPWLEGFSFQSWFPQFAPPKYWDEIVNDCCDFIYISHTHSDHFSPHTLKKIRKDMVFVCPNFKSQSVVRSLQAEGFEHLSVLNFNEIYNPCRGSGTKVRGSNIYLQLMQSGDGRDDSGLYFTCGNFSFLTQVDSVDFNNNYYPDYCTMFASSFAGGASSYPLCFDTVKDKKQVVNKLLHEVRGDVVKAVKKVMPKFFLPYAGFATPILPRDKFIRDNDKLLTPDNYIRTIGRNMVDVLDVRDQDTFVFNGGDLVETKKIKRERPTTTQQALNLYKKTHKEIITSNEVIQYFMHSEYKDDLILFLELTDDYFKPLDGASYQGKNKLSFKIDFTDPLDVKQITFNFENEKNKNYKERLLYLRIHADAATPILRKKQPLEDLMIGYHCRVDRDPDIYNETFWSYFSNIYIA